MMMMIIMMMLVVMVTMPMSVASVKSQFYKLYIFLFLIYIKNHLCLECTNENYNNIVDDDDDDDDDDVASIVTIYYMTYYNLQIIFIIYK